MLTYIQVVCVCVFKHTKGPDVNGSQLTGLACVIVAVKVHVYRCTAALCDGSAVSVNHLTKHCMITARDFLVRTRPRGHVIAPEMMASLSEGIKKLGAVSCSLFPCECVLFVQYF